MKEKQTKPAVYGRSAVDHPKRILALLLTFAMLATALCLPAFAVEETAPAADTEGEAAIQIATAADFLAIYDGGLAGNYELTNDITLELAEPLTGTFTGVLDGKGHTLTISIANKTHDNETPNDTSDDFFYNSDSASGALFGNLKGTVKNLNVGSATDPVELTFYQTSGYNPGGLASQAQGNATVSNVHLWANLDYTHCTYITNIGGFFGKVTSATSLSMENCSVNGTMTWMPETASAKQHGVGGFIGLLAPSAACEVNFDTCVSNMAITDQSTLTGTANTPIGVGGFIGKITTANATVTMTDCVNAGDVTSSMANKWCGYSGAGGFVGLCTAASNLTMTNCENKGNVTSANICGGLLGNWYTGTATIQYCVNRGSITGTNVGGLVGVVFQATDTKVDVSHCVNTGTVTGSIRAGGIVGVGIKVTTIDSCVNMGAVTCSGKYNVGAIYGNNCTVENCYTTVAAKYTGATAGTVTDDSEAISVTQINEGAGVRIHNTADESGLRFKFTMDEASLAALATLMTTYGAANVEVGAVILPTELLQTEVALTAENYANAITMKGSASEITDGYYHASLVKLYADHYTTEYSGRSFWRFRTSADGEWITVYANNTLSRTIAEVAAEALNDPNKPNYSQEQLDILNAYANAQNG